MSMPEVCDTLSLSMDLLLTLHQPLMPSPDSVYNLIQVSWGLSSRSALHWTSVCLQSEVVDELIATLRDSLTAVAAKEADALLLLKARCSARALLDLCERNDQIAGKVISQGLLKALAPMLQQDWRSGSLECTLLLRRLLSSEHPYNIELYFYGYHVEHTCHDFSSKLQSRILIAFSQIWQEKVSNIRDRDMGIGCDMPLMLKRTLIASQSMGGICSDQLYSSCTVWQNYTKEKFLNIWKRIMLIKVYTAGSSNQKYADLLSASNMSEAEEVSARSLLQLSSSSILLHQLLSIGLGGYAVSAKPSANLYILLQVKSAVCTPALLLRKSIDISESKSYFKAEEWSVSTL